MATKIEKAVLLDLTALRILHASSKESFCNVMEKFAEIVLRIDDNVTGLTAMETEVLKVLVERANEGIEAMRKRTAGLKQNQKHKE